MRLQLGTVVLVACCVQTVRGAIVPSWRINTINAAALAANPELANAVSLSFMIDLSGGSVWNLAGLAFRIPPDATVFNHVAGTDGPPNPGLFPIFPGLEYDSYIVGTPMGPYDPNFPTSTGTTFNLKWAPPPQTSGEIARFTFLGISAPGSSPIPGEVRSTDAPGVAVPVPPIPLQGFTAIPEPASVPCFAILAGLYRVRRPA